LFPCTEIDPSLTRLVNIVVKTFNEGLGEAQGLHSSTKQIARQRIRVLFEQANVARKGNPKLSSRYVDTARKIAMAAKIRFPQDFRRRVCKKCNTFFVYGENCRVRVRQKREPHVVITCLNCGWQTRIPLRKKNQEKKEIEQDNDPNETPR
jgi:ribonuclease P protein subunit RPR2